MLWIIISKSCCVLLKFISTFAKETVTQLDWFRRSLARLHRWSHPSWRVSYPKSHKGTCVYVWRFFFWSWTQNHIFHFFGSGNIKKWYILVKHFLTKTFKISKRTHFLLVWHNWFGFYTISAIQIYSYHEKIFWIRNL